MKRFTPITAVIPCFFGFMALFNNLGKDRVAALHGAEVLGLVAAGFCFGITFMVLVIWSLTRKERNAAG